MAIGYHSFTASGASTEDVHDAVIQADNDAERLFKLFSDQERLISTHATLAVVPAHGEQEPMEIVYTITIIYEGRDLVKHLT